MTTEAARAYLEQARWPNGPVCPACDSATVHPRRSRPGIHRCARCDYEFTVRSGTIMEHSKVPLEKWAAVLCDWGNPNYSVARLLSEQVALKLTLVRDMQRKIHKAYHECTVRGAWLHRILSYRPPPKSKAAKKRLRERKQREFAEQQP